MHTLFADLPTVEERRDVSIADFKRDIINTAAPVVVRGLVNQWPATQIAGESDQAMCNYLQSLSPAGDAEVFLAGQSQDGNFFYDDSCSNLNFETVTEPLSGAIERVRNGLNADQPRAYCGSVPIEPWIPQFREQNDLTFFDQTIIPRLWLGNSAKVAAHYDLSDNLACVVAGRRRFILFPPDQVSNLYVGPMDFTLAGRPASLVQFDDPDLSAFPRFVDALTTAQTAVLEPGDAIYIPNMWWHHVESLSSLNVLVNYWWSNSVFGGDSGYDAMIHGMLTLSALPEHERLAWRAFYDHYVFRTQGEPGAHIPEHSRGVLGEMSPELYRKIQTYLHKSMKLSQ